MLTNNQRRKEIIMQELAGTLGSYLFGTFLGSFLPFVVCLIIVIGLLIFYAIRYDDGVEYAVAMLLALITSSVICYVIVSFQQSMRVASNY